MPRAIRCEAATLVREGAVHQRLERLMVVEMVRRIPNCDILTASSSSTGSSQNVVCQYPPQ